MITDANNMCNNILHPEDITYTKIHFKLKMYANNNISDDIHSYH